jgi:hypothetical protein
MDRNYPTDTAGEIEYAIGKVIEALEAFALDPAGAASAVLRQLAFAFEDLEYLVSRGH